jgi:hypothetical protein
MPAPHVLRTAPAEVALLAEAREADGLKLTAAGALLGVREHTLGGWLNGDRSAPPGLFLALGDALSPAGRVKLLHALASRWGLSITVEAAPAPRADLPTEVAQANLAGAQVSVAVAEVYADRRLTRQEEAKLRPLLASWQREVAEVHALVSAPATRLKEAA